MKGLNLASLSINRPAFVTCIVILLVALGVISLNKIPVDLFPNITFPVVVVMTPYPGAGPDEVENLISRVVEDEISTLGGIKTLRSTSKEGMSTVIAEFTLETDVKYAEQQVRDRMAAVKRKLPTDIKEPTIRRVDPADQPILILGVTADLPPAKLYDLADWQVRPKIEQVNQVGLVEVIGGRKREIQIQLDRTKLKDHNISATMVTNRIAAAGQNIPAGKVDEAKQETVFRTTGEFKDVKDIDSTIVNFVGNDVPITISEIGTVVDTVTDEKARVSVNGQRSIFVMVYRQSGANTIAVADAVRAKIQKINDDFKLSQKGAAVTIIRDTSKFIRANVDDVKESILYGILLTILVVYLFLANGRSTIITGLAIPNSLIGAFFIMSVCGFTVNVMTLLALSLAVGLLIDDAIVVRENIFRHNELGKSPVDASLIGTKEVTLAVIATTLAVIAVFGPVAFLDGVVGQFFKEFGLTVCFAMAISLFDALTMAPMLSAYFVGSVHGKHHQKQANVWDKTVGRGLQAFSRFQDKLELFYEKTMVVILRHPLKTLFGALLIFILSLVVAKFVPKTFMGASDAGEFSVSAELPPGATIAETNKLGMQLDAIIRANKEIDKSVMILGGRGGETNQLMFYIELIPFKARKGVKTTQVKDAVREQLKPFAFANPIVKDVDMIMGGQRPFTLNIIGTDLDEIEKVSRKVFDKLKTHPALKDVDISYRPGKPEFKLEIDKKKAQRMGISTAVVGQELRNQVEGLVPIVFRENGREYDIRVRMREENRNIRKDFNHIYVPNINNTLVRLEDVARPIETKGPASIDRYDRGRTIQILADLAPDGPGMGGVMADIKTMFEKDIQLPEGMRYSFTGQAESFKELGTNMVKAALLGILFIFLVLASLYESFVTPFTIMLVLPLAATGAFVALFVAHASLDIFSMIGCIMLLGIATKNSILLVDYANQQITLGQDRATAIILAGKTRLRPILMTTAALIAGMLPIAIGLNEASSQRTSMGVAVIGGLISSTLLSLIVVPAAFSYIDRFRVWSLVTVKRVLKLS